MLITIVALDTCRVRSTGQRFTVHRQHCEVAARVLALPGHACRGSRFPPPEIHEICLECDGHGAHAV